MQYYVVNRKIHIYIACYISKILYNIVHWCIMSVASVHVLLMVASKSNIVFTMNFNPVMLQVITTGKIVYYKMNYINVDK